MAAHGSRWKRPAAGLALGVVTVAAVSGLLAVVDLVFPAVYTRVIYVLPVLLVALVAGTWSAVVTAALGAVAFHYLFVPPEYSIKADHPRLYVSMIVFFVVAVIVGELTSRLRRSAQEATLLSKQLAASRARIVAAADQARCRIERDLHDGVQQRLVCLSLELRDAETHAPPELRGQLSDLAIEAVDTLDELRDLARGIHPAILAEHGLPAALKSLARRSMIPVELDARVDRRLPEQVELAAYYMVSEALANATKHADASLVSIDVDVDAASATLLVCVRDDGRGGADLTGGSGLLGLRDRVEAAGGRFSLQSAPGMGTAVRAELPM
jgi:signal transduction histidine kinase